MHGFEAYVKQCRDRGRMPGITASLPHEILVAYRDSSDSLVRSISKCMILIQTLRQLIKWKRHQYHRTGVADVFARRWTNALLERIHATRSGMFAGVLSTLSAGDSIVAMHMGMRSASVLHCGFRHTMSLRPSSRQG